MRQIRDKRAMRSALIAAAFAVVTPVAVYAQKSAALPLPQLTYADTADLAFAAPIVAEVRIVRAGRLEGSLAPGLAAGRRRFLVEADVMALIRGVGGLPPRINYIVDLAPGAGGKWPSLKRQQFIIFARAIPTKPGSVQLVTRDAQQPLTTALSARVRDVLREAGGAAAPPQIVGIGDAFHTAGTIEGEGETQIFLKSADGRPLSLSVWRRPGTSPRWAVSLGEIVDEGAAPPAPDTFLWYRLACALPPRIPPASVASLDANNAAIVAEDYATVIAGLGRCLRSRETRNPAQSF